MPANCHWRQGACCATHYKFPILPQTDPQIHLALVHPTLDHFQDHWFQMCRDDRSANFYTALKNETLVIEGTQGKLID